MAASQSNTSSGPAVIAVTSTLFGIAVILVSLRFYVRLLISKNVGWDDGVMLFTLGILIVGKAAIFKMVAAGAGRHLDELSESAISLVLRWNTVSQILNTVGAFFTKLSIGIFLLRLKNSKRLRLAIWIFLTPLALSTLVVVLFVLLQCVPLWPPSSHGHCISSHVSPTASYFQSAFAILTDLFLTASPIVILWNVKISRRKKIGICGLMSLGLMATIASALRNFYVSKLTENDFTLSAMVVADLEFSLGVIAACIPPLMPLFKRYSDRYARSKTSGQQSLESPIPRQRSTGDGMTCTTLAQDSFTVTTECRGYPLHELSSNNHITLQQSFRVDRT